MKHMWYYDGSDYRVKLGNIIDMTFIADFLRFLTMQRQRIYAR